MAGVLLKRDTGASVWQQCATGELEIRATTFDRPGDDRLPGEIRCQLEIRCQFIILARKDEPTPDYARDTGLRAQMDRLVHPAHPLAVEQFIGFPDALPFVLGAER